MAEQVSSYGQNMWQSVQDVLKAYSASPTLCSVLSKVILEGQPPQGGKKDGRTRLLLKVPSVFYQKILKSHLLKVESQIHTLGVDIPDVRVCSTVPVPALPTRPHKRYLLPVKSQSVSQFNPHWTFSSFIEGPNNNFAFSLAKSIARTPFKNHSNPLFIYGPSGLGKTHLLHAIGNALAKERPNLRVLYLPAERFFNDCISHIRKNEMPAFREKYRKNIHVLLLDDIPILGRGESTQEEFFHTYENLKAGHCQIVLTSDQRPKNIKGLKDAIKTRFEGGVVADIQTPDRDTKRAIIKAKATGLKLSDEMISHLLDVPTPSVRELEGQINKIKMFCELGNQPLSLKLFKQIFAEELSMASAPAESGEEISRFSTVTATATVTATVTAHKHKNKVLLIQKAVCGHFEIPLADLKSASREQKLVLARNIAIHLIRHNIKISLTDIGAFFGGRNHSTLLNSLKKIKKALKEKDPNTLKALSHLQGSIYPSSAKGALPVSGGKGL